MLSVFTLGGAEGSYRAGIEVPYILEPQGRRRIDRIGETAFWQRLKNSPSQLENPAKTITTPCCSDTLLAVWYLGTRFRTPFSEPTVRVGAVHALGHGCSVQTRPLVPLGRASSWRSSYLYKYDPQRHAYVSRSNLGEETSAVSEKPPRPGLLAV